MRVGLETDLVNIDFIIDGEFSTFGGMLPEDDYGEGSFGIQCEGFSISDIPDDKLARLAERIVNHLILNGYRFEFYKAVGGETCFREHEYNGN